MEVALITPTVLLPTIGNMTRYHMILPDIAQRQYLTYTGFYQRAVGYKILDNGAAEGVTEGPHALISIARSVGADEIVVPDVLGNGEETMKQGTLWKKSGFHTASKKVGQSAPRFKFMGVAQGVTVGELYSCVEFWLEQDWVTTIGFPRDMQKWGIDARVEAIDFWHDDILARDKEIHCLGSMKYVREVEDLADYHVRGIDTCAPIELARAGLSLSQGENEDAYEGRAPGFFHWRPTKEENWTVVGNCDTYLEWAQWEGYTPSEPLDGGKSA